jgi:hypothetical protein
LSPGILLPVMGDIGDFSEEGKLAAYRPNPEPNPGVPFGPI